MSHDDDMVRTLNVSFFMFFSTAGWQDSVGVTYVTFEVRLNQRHQCSSDGNSFVSSIPTSYDGMFFMKSFLEFQIWFFVGRVWQQFLFFKWLYLRVNFFKFSVCGSYSKRWNKSTPRTKARTTFFNEHYVKKWHAIAFEQNSHHKWMVLNESFNSIWFSLPSEPIIQVI